MIAGVNIQTTCNAEITGRDKLEQYEIKRGNNNIKVFNIN